MSTSSCDPILWRTEVQRIARTGLGIVVLLLSGSVSVLPAPARSGEPIRVILPQGVDADSCRFEYLIGGTFGGYGGRGVPRRELPGFEIQAVHDGPAVETASAFLACAGYQVVTMIIGSFAEMERSTFRVRLEPLANVHFAGVIRGWSASESGLYVEIRYSPLWTCRFFRLSDCLVAPWTLASVSVENDGSFAADLPDFPHDSVISRLTAPGDPGELAFLICERRTRNISFELKPVGSGPARRLSVRSAYPQEQMFYLEPYR